MSKPQLVLDVAGVLITNMSPLFWRKLSADCGISYEELVNQFKVNVREQLWTGLITEDDFWNWLGSSFPSIDLQNARSFLKSSLQPLPALDYLARWSQIADIHLLSNHRSEWISTALTPLTEYIKTVVISSDVGFCKPHREIYNVLGKKLNTKEIILFVDDQEKNLRTATEFGWKTLLADELGVWISQVEPLLIG